MKHEIEEIYFKSAHWRNGRNVLLPSWKKSFFPGRSKPARRLAALDQCVADFLEKLHLARGRRLACGLLLLLAAKLVHGLDRHEQDEGHDQEADHIVDEEADIHGRRAGLPRRGERIVVLTFERDEDAREIDATGDDADR